MASIERWSTQAKKGLLELCILNALRERERYGYDLVKALVKVPGLSVTEGTLYPLLSRLKGQGLVLTRLVESPEGPARKYYALSPKGRESVTMMNAYVQELMRGVLLLIERGDRA